MMLQQSSLRSAVDDLQKQGITGLVIDIRNNPGGVLKTVAGYA